MNNDFEMINFFDLKDDDLIVLNPYNFDEAIKRLESLTLEEVQDDLKYFQKKEFDFRNYEEETVYSLENVKFITSTKKNNGEDEFLSLNDLKGYLISDEELQKKRDKENNNKDNSDKKITLEIRTKEGGKKEILVKCLVNPKKFTENVIKNFLEKSTFEKAKTFRKNMDEYIDKKLEENNFRFTIKIDMNSLNKIYSIKNKGEYFFDFQSPPVFRTNFLKSEDKDNKEEKESKDKKNYLLGENSLFPFRNFDDEISNLKYRHFILMIKKKDVNNESTPRDDIDINFDTNDELNNSLENLFKNRKGQLNEEKYIVIKEIKLKEEDKNMKNLSYFFNYDKNKEIKRALKDLKFLKKNDEKEEDKDQKKYNDDNVIKLYYQVLALISECILSYYNGVAFLDNLLLKKKYRKDIFKKCTNEDFPVFFNITLTKILDKRQNSLKEISLPELEEEMENTFKYLYDQYENENEKMEEVLRPSKNEILMRVQRCVVTPTYILFTPYILDQGNRILREFVKINDSMLCTFKMDNLEEARWNNAFLVEYIKFIMSKGFFIGEKNFKFFNYSQSQFRNMSCWLLTEPEKIIPKLGNFSKIKQISKYGARISQTLTTTIKTITIPEDKIVKIKDVKSEDKKYTFSDGVGKISVVLSELISKKLKLDFIPSCFQGRFLGCKGVWTTMWNDKSGQIYCRDSQIKFEVIPDKKNNYFELCDYSRYIQSYLNRQIIILLSALGIEDRYFEKKLNEYKKKLNDQKFVLSLIHYIEWNQMLQKMNSCGINRINDRFSRSIIESNLDILYKDIKNKARIYVEESAYVIGIMDEYNILEYGEAYLQIKRDNFNIILDKKCTVAKCPCLHPGDIRVLRFRKYNKNNESTKKYEVFNNYENVIIFPSKGKRPHPDECSGSDLDGDNYFVFYDNDLIPKKTVEPMSYIVEKKEEDKVPEFTINNVIEYFAEYTNFNNLGLIGDAHLAWADQKTANSEICLNLAKKFSKAVDAPKTGDKITLDEDETPKQFPHFMGKNKRQTYTSTKILGRLYDKSCELISKRIKLRDQIGLFYDKDLALENWEKYAFLGLIYYRDYFDDLVNLLQKNEINAESVLLTGNNIDNDNSILSKKKHNYDLREKIGYDIHNLFIQNKNNFYNAIKNLFISKREIKNDKKTKENKNKNKIKNENKNDDNKNDDNNNENKYIELEYKDLINNELYFENNLNLFASACYMITYNIVEDVLKKNSSVNYYCEKFRETINDNLVMNNDFEELNEISDYESINIGVDSYETYESNCGSLYEQINDKKEIINNIINKNEKVISDFVERLKKIGIPEQSNQENIYRILSFPWCISGQVLSSIKIINFQYVD